MQDLLSIGTNRRESMIGTGIGLGLSGYSLSRTLFSPNKVSGLALWLDSSDSSTLYQSSGGTLAASNGDPIGQWQDKSGNSNHAVQADGLLKPQLVINSQVGKAGINFPDGTDYLAFSRIQGIKHIFFVAKRNTVGYPDNSPILRDAVGGNDKDGIFFGTNTSGTYRFYIQPGVDGGGFAGYSNWVNVPNNTACIGEVWTDGINRNLRLNASNSTSGANIYDIRSSQIGSYHDSLYNFIGVIYEICIFTNQLSGGNIASMQAYLRGKWSTP